MDNTLEINFNTLDVEKFRIKLNGKEYKLTPVNNNEQEDAQSDIPTLSAFAEQLIRELKHQHRYRTAETYRCASWAHSDFSVADLHRPCMTA